MALRSLSDKIAQKIRTLLNGRSGTYFSGTPPFRHFDTVVSDGACNVPVSRDEALEHVRRWLSSDKMVYPDLWDQCQIIECRMLFVPFWNLIAKVSGTIRGYREEPDGPPDYIRMQENLDTTFTWNGVACNRREIDVEYLCTTLGRISPPEKCQGPVPPVTVPLLTATGRGVKAIQEKILNHVAIPTITSKKISIVPREMSLFVYPMWRVKYTCSHRRYSVTIDGMTGEVMSGNAPGDLALRCTSFVRGTLLLLFWIAVGIAGIPFFLLYSNFPPSSMVIPVLVIIGLLVIGFWINWRTICESFAICRFGPRMRDTQCREKKLRASPVRVNKKSDANWAGITGGFILLICSLAPLVTLAYNPIIALYCLMISWPITMLGIFIIYMKVTSLYDMSSEAAVR